MRLLSIVQRYLVYNEATPLQPTVPQIQLPLLLELCTRFLWLQPQANKIQLGQSFSIDLWHTSNRKAATRQLERHLSCLTQSHTSNSSAYWIYGHWFCSCHKKKNWNNLNNGNEIRLSIVIYFNRILQNKHNKLNLTNVCLRCVMHIY